MRVSPAFFPRDARSGQRCHQTNQRRVIAPLLKSPASLLLVLGTWRLAKHVLILRRASAVSIQAQVACMAQASWHPRSITLHFRPLSVARARTFYLSLGFWQGLASIEGCHQRSDLDSDCSLSTGCAGFARVNHTTSAANCQRPSTGSDHRYLGAV